jgi:integrase
LIGDRDVKSIETTDVLAVLKPIWSSKAETAARLRQRMEIVMSFATAAGARSGLNPARWKDNLASLLPKMAKSKRMKHHAALAWANAAGFMAELQQQEGSAARALRFVIHTTCRSGEVRLATWREIDRNTATWVIPAERMKAHREHRIPLTSAALAVLGPRGERRTACCSRRRPMPAGRLLMQPWVKF